MLTGKTHLKNIHLLRLTHVMLHAYIVHTRWMNWKLSICKRLSTRCCNIFFIYRISDIRTTDSLASNMLMFYLMPHMRYYELLHLVSNNIVLGINPVLPKIQLQPLFSVVICIIAYSKLLILHFLSFWKNVILFISKYTLFKKILVAEI